MYNISFCIWILLFDNIICFYFSLTIGKDGYIVNVTSGTQLAWKIFILKILPTVKAIVSSTYS